MNKNRNTNWNEYEKNNTWKISKKVIAVKFCIKLLTPTSIYIHPTPDKDIIYRWG